MKSKPIAFKNKAWEMSFFKYRNGRLGIIMENIMNNKEWFSATLDIEKVSINENEIILKNHDLNLGLLDCFLDNEIIGKQTKSIILGYNTVYVCKLL